MDIPWEQLTPSPAPTALLQGSTGIVLRGTWQAPRRAPRAVAVKVLKATALLSASQAVALAALKAEASTMVAACDGNLNEFVAQLYGLARGPAPATWLAALGAGALACQVQPEGSGGGGGGDGAAPAQLLALVMRWEEGGTLAELLHSPTRAWGAGTGERLALCAQIASGLGALHFCSAGTIVHGDIKAENVLLSHAPGLHGAPRPRISDFGFAKLREAQRASRMSSVGSSTDTRGTWPYMAPEMFRSRTEPAAQASRTTDVYALGTLVWEVLSGELPWAGARDALDRLLAIREGGEGLALSSPPLPLDLPASVRALLERCLAVERGVRPKIGEVAEALHQAAQAISSGQFDVFLSHAWEGGRHTPLTTEVYTRLTEAGLRVWLDAAEMGPDPTASMKDGIRRSKCIVALLNERYGTRPNCLRELGWAREMGKPVVGCLAEARGDWFLGEVLQALLPPEAHLFADLRAAAGVDWGAGEALAAGKRELLTKAPTALPLVLRFVQQLVASVGADGSGGSVGGSAGSVAGEASAEARGGGSGAPGGLPSASAVGSSGASDLELPAAAMGAARVVELLLASVGDAHVAEAGLGALREIALSAFGKDSCVSCGAVPAVLAVLKAHAGSATLAQHGCWALANIAVSDPGGEDACVSSGAVPAVVAALVAHAGVPAVAQYGCRALLTFASSVPGQDACVSFGAVPAVVAALKTHACLADVAEYGCWALKNIASSERGKDACISSGAISALVTALEAHADKDVVAQYGCWALSNIAVSDTGRDACLSTGAVRAVVAALKVPTCVAAVAQYSCRALAVFSFSTSGQAACVSAGAVPVVVAALKAHAGWKTWRIMPY